MGRFYCDECGRHVVGETKHEVTSRRGYEWRVCDNCIQYCKYCEEEYPQVDSYAHEDCAFQFHKDFECENSSCSYCSSSEEEDPPDVKEPEIEAEDWSKRGKIDF